MNFINDWNFNIGTDIENINRFRNYKKNNRFLINIFTKNELDFCFTKSEPAPHLAVRFAGKEAIIKALNGICNVNPLYNQIEIMNNKSGAPIVKFNNKNIKNIKVLLSLSHCQDKALAFAILSGEDDNGQ